MNPSNKWRKKPIIVEAIRWHPGIELDGIREHDVECHIYGSFNTIHNQSTLVEDGDWVIRESDGVHWYPCKADIFEKTYEAVE